MTEFMQLDEDKRLHLGGYLAYQLADFRARMGPRLLHPLASASRSVENTLYEICSIKEHSQLAPKIQEADRILVQLKALIDRLRSRRQKDFLMPLFLNSSAFLHRGDSQIHQFLQLLCDVETPCWVTIREFCHNAIMDISGIAGFLYNLDSYVARADHATAMALLRSRREGLSLAAKLMAEMFDVRNLLSEFRATSAAITGAYLRSPYHHKGAELLTQIIQARIAVPGRNAQSQKALANEFTWVRSVCLNQHEPFLTPMLKFIRAMEPCDEADQILLNDPQVIFLKEQVAHLLA